MPHPALRCSAPAPRSLPHAPRPRFPQAQEAEALYQACVREANARQQDLEAAKRRIVSHVRKLVLQGDEVLRRVRLFPTERPLPLNCLQGTRTRSISLDSQFSLPASDLTSRLGPTPLGSCGKTRPSSHRDPGSDGPPTPTARSRPQS